MIKKAVITASIKRITVKESEVRELYPAVYDGETLITPAATEVVSPALYENVLDLPSAVCGQTVACEGVNYYHQVPQDESFVGKECLVYIQYDPQVYDYTKFSGFIGDPTKNWKRIIMDHSGYRKHWSQKKADTLATTDQDGNVIPYVGDDANDPTELYFGMTWDETKEHPTK